ncbi:hypothetical protein [Kitasatospora sp. NBC_01539]|uniref:hypothetical protein n=1 Tax=Kitasatospora sp. NBC_01539 TaxID=2903577 RepID=UPI003860337F
MRCGVCGSDRLSPVGELTTEALAPNFLHFKFPRPRLFRARPTFVAQFARACRDCGTLFPCLGDYERKLLDDSVDGLA